MDNTEFEKLVNAMPLEDSEKQKLLADAASGISLDQLVVKVKEILAAKQDALDKANPEAAADHAAADKEYEGEVAKASAQFDTTMTQIEKESDDVGAEVLKRLDSARADEIKDSI